MAPVFPSDKSTWIFVGRCEGVAKSRKTTVERKLKIDARERQYGKMNFSSGGPQPLSPTTSTLSRFPLTPLLRLPIIILIAKPVELSFRRCKTVETPSLTPLFAGNNSKHASPEFATDGTSNVQRMTTRRWNEKDGGGWHEGITKKEKVAKTTRNVVFVLENPDVLVWMLHGGVFSFEPTNQGFFILLVRRSTAVLNVARSSFPV
ncbi:hypothetical protein GYMLUDRAFT_251216 [Collybiopsis luxurians FD-317 M1]|uniref:Uncharacterized protein n=1 Tax=Collybiopsis luxurians FD-317 M1 TaxID=944289 RepID=A0A0D0CBV2_9AGAR|nr:hypothetical protein GYMLUDRAFT_251216 [Collybiopsis luxurians FD-317 M1]